MTPLRNLTWLIVLAITFSAIAVPNVIAQTTSITNLQAPSTATVGKDVTVVVAATYNLGSNGYAVSVGIFDRDAWWAPGTAQSSQNTCHIYPNEALCSYIPKSASGSDVVTFDLQFSSVKTYRLRAAVELYYSNAQLISSASIFQDFTITVQPGPSSTQEGNVIYGSSVGLPSDATIQSVAFTLQGDNLVTTFQVKGAISTAYGYTIGIRASEASSNDQYSDYIISYSYTPVGAGPYFLDGKTNTATPIVDSTVSGGTWTASVPLSWTLVISGLRLPLCKR